MDVKEGGIDVEDVPVLSVEDKGKENPSTSTSVIEAAEIMNNLLMIKEACAVRLTTSLTVTAQIIHGTRMTSLEIHWLMMFVKVTSKLF